MLFDDKNCTRLFIYYPFALNLFIDEALQKCYFTGRSILQQIN